jgi:hypothetical protein
MTYVNLTDTCSMPESFIWVYATLWILAAIGMIFLFYFIGLMLESFFRNKSIAGHN